MPKAAGDEFVLDNRVGFAQWVYSHFSPEFYRRSPGAREPAEDSQTCGSSSAAATAEFRFFPHQQLIRDFLHVSSPYRGLLLYHQLGSGKSCTSIAAAEAFVSSRRRVYILVPASLENNYRTELTRCASCGNPHLKLWKRVAIPKSAEAKQTLFEKLEQDIGLSRKFLNKQKGVVIVPASDVGGPAAAPAAWTELSPAEQAAATETMHEIIQQRYHFIRYNGLTESALNALGAHAFDDSFVVIDEAHNFISRVVNGSKIQSRLYKRLMEASGVKMVLLSGTPIINHPFELAMTLNLVRGPMTVEVFQILKTAKNLQPDPAEILEALGDELAAVIDQLTVDIESRTIRIVFLPRGYARSAPGGFALAPDTAANFDHLVARIHAFLSANYGVSKQRPGREQEFALPRTKEAFNELFLDEGTDDRPPAVKNADLFLRRIMGTVSYFRTVGEAYFPRELPRQIVEIPMSHHQYSKYIDVRETERRMERSKRNQARAAGGVFGVKGTVYRAFSRMACNFVFPDDIKRVFPKKLRAELSKEIASVDVEEGAADAAAAPDAALADLKKRYERRLAEVMNQLESRGSEVLGAAALARIYSPKFARILADIVESPGSCLVYSQFRAVEGLGILRLVLEAAGFAEIRVDAAGAILDADHVLAPEFDGRRFVVFNEDRAKTDVLLRIFNGTWASLPAATQAALAPVAARAGHGPTNLYGAVARVMMITQSGAEGISLRNVRRVLLTEPFWNMVRINQVIGRAFRTCSHQDLPLADRDVQVFIYQSIFTPKQLADNFTLQRLDNSQTSDSHIWTIAKTKDAIVQQFLDCLKRAAMDCLNNAGENRLTHPANGGLQCYAFPLELAPETLSYLPRLQDDVERRWSADKFERVRRIRGRVVRRGTAAAAPEVIVDGLPGFYDYNAYKDAGVLVPLRRTQT